MNPIVVSANTRLLVTYSFHAAPHPVSKTVVVLHHGILHTREHFLPLIEKLNERGIHAAMIDQQSEQAGFLRNFIGLKSYRIGMAAAVRQIEEETKLRIGSFALHSMGALIGEETQQHSPELRRPTVLMAPIPVNGALPISLRILRRHPLSYLKAVLTLDIHSLAKTPAQVREHFFDHLTPEPIVEQAAAKFKHVPFWSYVQLVFRWLFAARIQNDNLPKLLLFSETDEIFHPREYEKTRDRYPQLEQAQIKGGHDFFIEYAETTAEHIANFHIRNEAKPTTESPPLPPPHFLSRPDTAKSVEAEKREVAGE